MSPLYVPPVREGLADAKGDLLVATAADTVDRLAVGSNGTAPVANSGDTSGVGWAYADIGGLPSAYRASSSMLSATMDPRVCGSGTVGTFVDGTVKFWVLYLPYDATITGVGWLQGTQGNYTADNNNKVGLYTSDGTNLTLVASSASDDALWSTYAAGTVGQKAFSSTYAAQAGRYWVAALYNNSGQTTAPTVYATPNATSGIVNDVLMSDTDEFTTCSVAGLTDLPATQAWSGVTLAGQNQFWFLY